MSHTIAIPYDIYESESHILCIIPMGGVTKSSVSISLRDYALHISATRHKPDTLQGFVKLQQQCYRGATTCVIDLPTHIDFDGIESTLSRENILSITIPKKTEASSEIPVVIE